MASYILLATTVLVERSTGSALASAMAAISTAVKASSEMIKDMIPVGGLSATAVCRLATSSWLKAKLESVYV